METVLLRFLPVTCRDNGYFTYLFVSLLFPVIIKIFTCLICYDMLQVESEYLPLYSNYGIGLTTWSPLASGVLSGKYSLGSPRPSDTRFALDNYKVKWSRSWYTGYCKSLIQIPQNSSAS